MALTLGNPTLETIARNALSDALDALINTGAGTAVLTLRNSTTVLVTFNLQNPAFGASAAGVITLQGVPISATASAGSATTPDNYQVINRDAALTMSGAVTGTGPITSGETVNLNSYSYTTPAS